MTKSPRASLARRTKANASYGFGDELRGAMAATAEYLATSAAMRLEKKAANIRN